MPDDVPSYILPNFPDIGDETEAWADHWWSSLPKEVLRMPANTPSDQWLRRMELMVYGGGGAGAGGGIRLSGMRVNFQVKKQTAIAPNMLYARIYNLAPGTAQKVKQFTKVALSAGYWGTDGDPTIFSLANIPEGAGGGGGNYGLIFQGTVIMFIQGKETAVDTYLDIWAGDGDREIGTGYVNITFPAKTTLKEKAEKIIKDGFKVEVGKVDIKGGDTKSVRAETVVGMAVNAIRDVANMSNTHYWIEDGKGFLIPFDGYASDEMVVLSPTTGLIGMPKVTPDGIQAQCLLNPKLRLGGKVKIDGGVLSDVPYLPGGDGNRMFSTGGANGSYNANASWGTKNFAAAATSPTGTYKILDMEHSGDNRGQPWYTNLICSSTEAGAVEPNIFARSAYAANAQGGGASGLAGASGGGTGTGGSAGSGS